MGAMDLNRSGYETHAALNRPDLLWRSARRILSETGHRGTARAFIVPQDSSVRAAHLLPGSTLTNRKFDACVVAFPVLSRANGFADTPIKAPTRRHHHSLCLI